MFNKSNFYSATPKQSFQTAVHNHVCIINESPVRTAKRHSLSIISNSGYQIAKEFLNYLDKHEIAYEDLVYIGGDGTSVNTGPAVRLNNI